MHSWIALEIHASLPMAGLGQEQKPLLPRTRIPAWMTAFTPITDITPVGEGLWRLKQTPSIRCGLRLILWAPKATVIPAPPACWPAVMNAVVDALSEYDIRHTHMPATLFEMWQVG
jgi:hypothetical protein